MSLVNPRVAEKFRIWRNNPVQFVRDNFKVEPDAWQHDVLMAAVTNIRIAMKACKGPGKSCVLAWLIWWFLACYPHSKILATSITGDNLRDNLWAELAHWQKASVLLSNAFQWNAERIANKEHPETWFCSARTWSKGADPSQQANTLAGHHGDYTMIVLDEVGDIPNGVYAAADASLSTGKKNLIVMAGNPTRTDGPLWDACTRDRKLWWVIEITGDPDDPKRSPRISVTWAREQIDRWGPDNPWVLVNVFGKFPPTQSDKLLGPEDVDAAMRRSYGAEILNPWPVVFGGDVAKSKGRNRSVLWKRQGPVAWLLGEWRLDDHTLLAQQWARILADHQMRGEDVLAFFIDKGGMSGVHEVLIQLGWTCIIGVDNGEAASDPKFLNKRSELWWEMSSDVKKRLSLPYNPTLKIELTSPTFEFKTVGTKGTRFVLESKEEMMDRGLESPDLADGLALTYYAPVAMREDINRPKLRNQRAGHAATAYEPFGGQASEENPDEEEYRYGIS